MLTTAPQNFLATLTALTPLPAARSGISVDRLGIPGTSQFIAGKPVDLGVYHCIPLFTPGISGIGYPPLVSPSCGNLDLGAPYLETYWCVCVCLKVWYLPEWPRLWRMMINHEKPSELVVLINPAFSGKPNVKSMKIPFEKICRQMLLGAPAAKGPAPAHAPEAEGEWMGF